MKGYIYKFTNLINNKIYIGQTRQKLNNRYKQHLKAKDNYPIHAAIRKYGIENFSFTTIEIIEADSKELLIDELNKLEINYIKEYNSLVPFGYNIEKGGVGKIPELKKETLLKKLQFINKDIIDQKVINKINGEEYPSIIEAFINSKISNFMDFYYDMCYNLVGNFVFKHPEQIKFPGEVFPKNSTLQDIIDKKAIRYVLLPIQNNTERIENIEDEIAILKSEIAALKRQLLNNKEIVI